MIINKTRFTSTVKLTDPSVVSLCNGVSNLGTGLSGIRAGRSESLSAAPAGVLTRDERPLKVLEAGEAKALAYVFAAAGAGNPKQTTQHDQMWAFRGPDPWSDPA
ncbi:MAG TPA: hypothetical protein VIU15_06620 [Streptomyces sp.]